LDSDFVPDLDADWTTFRTVHVQIHVEVQVEVQVHVTEQRERVEHRGRRTRSRGHRNGKV